ncbi:hypothetical protein [Pontibacter rugosus]|uniref:DUF4136 domain-containing protein n=1 Tax=Pontibacter rugosus TaxID=1745966 RepID=A0ABW3SMR5_9BACT
MKKLPHVLLLLLLGLSSCTKNVYTRPVTIDGVEFTNKAGDKYEAQFQRVNGWFLQRIKALEKKERTFAVDTATAKKRYHKYNHTLVASLEPFEVGQEPGVYYQLYLKPNSGVGKMKGNVQKDIYNQLKLYSPDKYFLQHGEQYYTDSVVVGPFRSIVPVQEFLKPVNTNQQINISIDSINFPDSFKKRQREFLMRLVNNAMVLRQEQIADKNPNTTLVFDYYPNFRAGKDKKATTYAANLNVVDDPASNEIIIKISSPGYTPGKWQATNVVLNRQEFLDGHTYEVNQLLGSLAPVFFSYMHYSKSAQQ